MKEKSYAEMTVSDVKRDIVVKILANGAYYVPHGFLRESYKTKLHLALRELHQRDRRIYLHDVLPMGEMWKLGDPDFGSEILARHLGFAVCPT